MKNLIIPSIALLLVFFYFFFLMKAKPRAGTLLVDVRTPEEYRAEHAKGSILLPLDQIRGRAEQVLPDKSATIDLYCRSGTRSGMAAQILKEMGYANVRNAGSLRALKNGGAEVEPGEPGAK